MTKPCMHKVVPPKRILIKKWSLVLNFVGLFKSIVGISLKTHDEGYR